MVSRIKELSEEGRVSVRNVRRDGNKAAEQEEKNKELSEDERDSIKSEIQDLTKKYEKQITDLAQVRENDVMED